AMDDDDLRRGRPTVHKHYDEATAILAGDALLTQAFALLADPVTHPDPAIRIALVAELAAGSGAGGMAGGQMRDIEGEKGGFSAADIATMQAMKTGALIRASVRMGALLGGVEPRPLSALTAYAEAAGRAFQLADDILDVTASPETMGKATGKDEGQGKQTLVAQLGLDGARKMLDATIAEAQGYLRTFGPRADGLRATARFFGSREK
ncbi:MAG: polyprenyl synthetase family protein, partial [Devosia sp.]|nr:polyprenyl synthetase family protein [Devosia sp.]